MMKKITFDEEELFAIAVFPPDTRMATAEQMGAALKELSDDADMRALVVSAMEKLKRITDEEYGKLGLDGYREELEDDEGEDEDEKASGSQNEAGSDAKERREGDGNG